MERKRIILDVDTGIDDALAILFALKSPHLAVEGITTCFGNVSVEQATKNTLQVIELAALERNPTVAMGADQPLLRKWSGPVPHIHGENGLGNVVLPEPAQMASIEHAADYIVRKVNENVGEITLVFVGRLTNLALALAKDAKLPEKVKEVVFMGGAIRVPGNVTPVAEANIAGDPEAAHLVFESGLPLTMVGLDVTMQAVFTAEDLERLIRESGQENQAMIQFVRKIMEFRFDAYKREHSLGGSPLHDPLAVAVVADPSLVKKEKMWVKVETKGELSSGATIADLRGTALERTNLSVCVEVDRNRFIEQFISVLSGKGVSANG